MYPTGGCGKDGKKSEYREVSTGWVGRDVPTTGKQPPETSPEKGERPSIWICRLAVANVFGRPIDVFGRPIDV